MLVADAYPSRLTMLEYLNAGADVSDQQKLIAYCDEEVPRNNLSSIIVSKRSSILIGPEGDFSRSEIELALERKYIPVSLGETRLRTETAGIVAAALMKMPGTGFM
jgi:16S rRNA (uracil1498-N3)-methyltransferase